MRETRDTAMTWRAAAALLLLAAAPLPLAAQEAGGLAAAPIPQPGVAQPAAPQPAAPQPATPEPAAAGPQEPEITARASNALSEITLPPLVGWSGSLMYSLEDQRRLRNILKLYEAFKAGKIEKPSATGEGDALDSNIEALLNEKQIIKPPPPPPAPQYLSSIIFHTPQKWSIWLNEEKISSLGERPEVPEIVSVQKTMVELAWPLAVIRESVPDWEEMIAEKRRDPLLRRYLADYRIDGAADRVIFRLRPNQTLMPADFELVEGRVVAAPERPTASQPPAAPPGSGVPGGAAAPGAAAPGAITPGVATPGAATPAAPVPPSVSPSPEEAFKDMRQSPAARIRESLGISGEGVPPEPAAGPPAVQQPAPSPGVP